LEKLPESLALQIRVSRMLGYGFAFSLVWLGGVGSLVAFVLGLRALKVIRGSRGEVTGGKLAWWCIVAGAVGTVALLPFFIIRLLGEAKQ
jgi:hypothetical protein